LYNIGGIKDLTGIDGIDLNLEDKADENSEIFNR